MSTGNAHRILVVDDEVNIVIAIEHLLQKAGFITEKAYNAEEALAQFSRFEPLLVLLDVMMPGMNGFDLALSLRKASDNPGLKIIFLTARGTDKDKLEAYSKGGDSYVTKPFDNEALLELVKETLIYG